MAHLKALIFRKVLTGFLMLSLFVLLISLLCGGYLLYPSLRARYLLNELNTLQIGHSTFNDAEQLATNIHAKPDPYRACDITECMWIARMDNAQIPAWWRGSGHAFSVSFSVKNSLVVHKSTGYGVGLDGSFHPSMVIVEEQERWPNRNARESLEIGWGSSDWYPYYQFGVRITPNASTEDRKLYTSLNFNCLWKYRGCKDARELLPIAALTPLQPQPQ